MMACSKLSSTVSFAEIVKDRDSSVRVTGDRLLYAVDLVMVMHGSDRNYASQVFIAFVCFLAPSLLANGICTS